MRRGADSAAVRLERSVERWASRASLAEARDSVRLARRRFRAPGPRLQTLASAEGVGSRHVGVERPPPSALAKTEAQARRLSTQIEIRRDWPFDAVVRSTSASSSPRRPRAFGFERLGRRRSIVFGKLCRHIASGRSDGLDLLAQNAKAAIAQKFAMAAEHRRGGQRDQPAPIKPRERPLEATREKVWRSPSTRVSSSPRSNPTRLKKSLDGLAAIGRVGPDRGDQHGMRRAKAALLVKGP